MAKHKVAVYHFCHFLSLHNLQHEKSQQIVYNLFMYLVGGLATTLLFVVCFSQTKGKLLMGFTRNSTEKNESMC
jgi:hypothetical protein